MSAYRAGDYQTAFDNLQPLAERGSAVAQTSLGFIYYKGHGVPQNDAEAVRWFRAAAEQGHVFAQSHLGYMYQKGRGVPQNDAEAVRWFRAAAEQGHAFGQASLGLMYGEGLGVPQDSVRAHMWFNLSGANGYDLGREYRDKLTKIMTREQIAEAQRMAQICMQSDYTNCD